MTRAIDVKVVSWGGALPPVDISATSRRHERRAGPDEDRS
jgi:hypothetical protein